MATIAFEDLGATGSADEPNECRTEHNQGKRDRKEEDADECRGSEQAQGIVLERTFADTDHRFDNDCKHRRFQSKEQSDDNGDISVERIEVTQRHNGDDARNDEQTAGDEAKQLAIYIGWLMHRTFGGIGVISSSRTASRTGARRWSGGGFAPTIKALRAAGATSLQAIANGLNAQGIPTSRGQGAWSAVVLGRIT